MKSTVAIIFLGAFIFLTNVIGETSAGNKREAPYLGRIKLYIRNKAGLDFKICAGTLISFSYVLTARHCFFNVDRGEIILRADDMSPYGKNKLVIQFNTTQVIQHETADLGLIKLPTPLKKEEGLLDVVVLPSKSDRNVTKPRRAVVFGWGTHYSGTNRIDLTYHSSVVDLIGLCNDYCESSEEVCSKNAPQDKKPCYYDAGGTVIWKPTNLDHEMVGIVTWGGRECNRRVSNRFVSIAKYLDWLQQNSDAVIRP